MEETADCPPVKRKKTMAQAQDFTAAVNEALGAFAVDPKALEAAFKSTAVLNEKLSGVALGAAETSNDIASKTTKDTLAALAKVGKAKAEPADYANALTTFANFAADQAAKNLASYAEVSRKAQAEALELLVAAGKDASAEAAVAVKKAAKKVAAK